MITIILAAGESTRFKDFKPLTLIEGKPMIERVLDSLNFSDKIGIITGHRSDDLEKALGHREDVFFIHNPYYQQGLSTSVHRAIKYAEEKDEDLLITLADLPFVEGDDYKRLRSAYVGNPIFASFEKIYGPPCIIPKKSFALKHKMSGDLGLKSLFGVVDLVSIPNAAKDIDTEQDLKNF